MIVRARAPVRLDFAGGWTDVAPFATEARGSVVNAAIACHANVTLELGGRGYRLESRELGQGVEAGSLGELEPNGTLDLVKAAIRMYQPGPCRVVTSSEAPPGSGLGSSGAMDVALVAAFEAAVGRRPDPASLAERAWELEAVEAKLPGGKQDQYAAAFGGFSALGFSGAAPPSRRALRLPEGFAAQLARRILVCYTGRSRLSGDTIARVMTRYVGRDPGITGALEGLAEVADQMAAALEAGAIDTVAALLADNWRLQCRLDGGMRTEEMAGLEAAAAAEGALGGKAAGAGAGGTMFFVMAEPIPDPAALARRLGAEGIPLRWAEQGVTVW